MSLTALRMDAPQSPLDVELEKRTRLLTQWPKRCGCGVQYVADWSVLGGAGPFKPWSGLRVVGAHSEPFADHELRNCQCGSTLMVVVRIHDLGME